MNQPLYLESKIGSILLNWYSCSSNDRLLAIKALMPEDDPNTLSFLVRTHPGTKFGIIYIACIEIEVFDKNTNNWICDIRINNNQVPSYRFT